jgi:hypothetical protein
MLLGVDVNVKGAGMKRMLRRGVIAAVGPAVLLAMLLVGGASAATTTSPAYECQAPMPNAEAPPPIPQIAIERHAVPAQQPPDLCPGDEVPYPIQTGRHGVKVSPVSHAERAAQASPRRRVRAGRSPRLRAHNTQRRHVKAKAAREPGEGGGYYSYGAASQVTPGKLVELYEEQTNQQPYVAVSNSHSIGQMWLSDESDIGPKGPSTIEMGWIEAPGQYPDVETHLFLAMSDLGNYKEGGYIGLSTIPWVQVSGSVYPNMIITHDDRVHGYAIEERSGNWWYYYDGTWIGYVPHSAWKKHFPNVNEIEVGGEVFTPEFSTCTDMGNGLYGTQANSAGVVFTWWLNHSLGKIAEFSEANMTDVKQYTDGQWSPATNADSFHYGGPGWC